MKARLRPGRAGKGIGGGARMVGVDKRGAHIVQRLGMGGVQIQHAQELHHRGAELAAFQIRLPRL
jgi:hypothetical protein